MFVFCFGCKITHFQKNVQVFIPFFIRIQQKKCERPRRALAFSKIYFTKLFICNSLLFSKRYAKLLLEVKLLTLRIPLFRRIASEHHWEFTLLREFVSVHLAFRLLYFDANIVQSRIPTSNILLNLYVRIKVFLTTQFEVVLPIVRTKG